VSRTVRHWIAAFGVKMLALETAHFGVGGTVSSLMSASGADCFDGKAFYSLKQGRITIKKWRRHCNITRPHSVLGYRWLAPETIIPIDPRQAMH